MRRAWPLLLLGLLLLAFLWRREWDVEAPTSRRPSAPVLEIRRPSDVPVAGDVASPPTAAPGPEAVPEKPDACLSGLLWLLERQNEDGSWGDGAAAVDGALVSRPGITALALLSMLGAGYSHLSKDAYGGRTMGDAVRRGLQYLLADLREDGMFRSARSGLDQALAAMALSEAYGLTGSNLFKEQAQAAIRGTAALQIQDGSWGDAATTAWAADVFYSAELSGLDFPAAVRDGLRAHHDRRAGNDAVELLARMQLDRNKRHPAIGRAAARLAAAPPSADQPLAEIYLQSRAAFQFDGPSGPLWQAWNEPFKRAVLSRQRRDGAWPGAGLSDTIVQTSLGTLSLEVYYRYANVFAVK